MWLQRWDLQQDSHLADRESTLDLMLEVVEQLVGTSPRLQCGPGSLVARAAVRRLGETPFAVIDLETTGFAGHLEDRVVELAVIHTDPSGRITNRWSTLVNPGGAAGPTQIHGLRSDDLSNAPFFAELTDWLTDLLAGRVIVAHNAAYDLAFLTTEYERADVEPPDWATLCTLELNRHLGATDFLTLQSCCAAYGISLNAGHTALGDATATANLLRACLSHATTIGLADFPSIGCEKPLPPADHLPIPSVPPTAVLGQ